MQKWANVDGPGKFSGKREDYARWKKTTKRIMAEQEWSEAQMYSWLTNPDNMNLPPDQGYWIRIYSTSDGVWGALDSHFPKNGYALKKLINELKAVKPPGYNNASECRVFETALRGADEKAGLMGEQVGRNVLAEVFSREMEAHYRREILDDQWMDKVDDLVDAEPDAYDGSVGWMRALTEIARRRVTKLLRREEMEEEQPTTEKKRDKTSRVSKVGPPSMVSEAAPMPTQEPAAGQTATMPANNNRPYQRLCPWCNGFDHSMYGCRLLRGDNKKDRRSEAHQAGRCTRCMLPAVHCEKRCTGVAKF